MQWLITSIFNFVKYVGIDFLAFDKENTLMGYVNNRSSLDNVNEVKGEGHKENKLKIKQHKEICCFF